jgi:chaperonin GroES
VFFRKYGGVDIKIDGEDYIIISEEDVLAIVG